MKKNEKNVDYKELLANIIELKGFDSETQNLLLSILYKIDDSYDNYENVKREVPAKIEYIKKFIYTIRDIVSSISIVKPTVTNIKAIKDNEELIPEVNSNRGRRSEKIIALPNEESLVYAVTKAGSNRVLNKMSADERAIMSTIGIGKCISTTEAIRDFTGWAWSQNARSIESSQCNIIYIFSENIYGLLVSALTHYTCTS